MATSRMLSIGVAARFGTIPCPICGVQFGPRKTPKGFWYISTFCSKKCGRAARGDQRRTLTCPICSTTFLNRLGGLTNPRKYCSKRCSEIGMRNPEGWTRRVNGYVVFWTGKAEVLLHRIVMEGKLGRSLRDTETVHHINGQRDDNRPENLELWDHAQPHGQRVADKLRWCVGYLAAHRYVAMTDRGPAMILDDPHVSTPHSDALSAFVKLVESRGPLP